MKSTFACNLVKKEWLLMTEQELDSYWSTLLSLSGKRKDLEEDRKKLLASFKYPKSLFRFRSVTENSLTSLQENKVYFSSANHYDDPFDTYLRVDISKLISELKNTIEKTPISYEFFHILVPNCSKEQFIRAQNKVQSPESFSKSAIALREYLQNNLYSICFCEDVQNEVVWLKYAENHKGFVIEYSINDELLKNVWNEYYKANLFPVYYSTDGYDASDYFNCKVAYAALGNNNTSLLDSFMKGDKICWESIKISTIKKKCHEEDKEWRLVPLDTLEKREFVTWQPQSITIGLRTPEYKKQLIISAAKIAGISEFYQMIIDEHDEFVRVPLKI